MDTIIVPTICFFGKKTLMATVLFSTGVLSLVFSEFTIQKKKMFFGFLSCDIPRNSLEFLGFAENSYESRGIPGNDSPD